MAIENRDASYLTEMYLGQEPELWTPCLHKYFTEYLPKLPVRECNLGGTQKFRSKTPRPEVIMTRTMKREPGIKFLSEIDRTFNVSLAKDSGHWKMKGKKNCDIAGFQPDILLLDRNNYRVVIFENKPYDKGSTLTGSQEDDCFEFVKWLQEKGIPCDYIFVSPQEWTHKWFAKLASIQKRIPGQLGFIWYEDIFSKMADDGFVYAEIGKAWSGYTKLDASLF